MFYIILFNTICILLFYSFVILYIFLNNFILKLFRFAFNIIATLHLLLFGFLFKFLIKSVFVFKFIIT